MSLDGITEEFLENGFAVVKGAFPTKTAEKCREALWRKLDESNIKRDDVSTWPIKFGISECYTKEDGAPWDEVFTSTLQDAIDAICGPDSTKSFGAGWWMITFPGHVDGPWCADGNWHIDGHWYTHYPYSPEVGLVAVMFFSDVKCHGGGTAVLQGSHHFVSHCLVEAGLRGLSSQEISHLISCNLQVFEIVELTGQAGDVVLMHPWLAHSRSTNCSETCETGVRFMCHPGIALHHPMNFSLPDSSLSVLEKSILYSIRNGGDEFALQMITPEAVEHFLSRRWRKRTSAVLLEQDDTEGDLDRLMGFSSFSSSRVDSEYF